MTRPNVSRVPWMGWKDIEPVIQHLTYRQIDYWIREGAISLSHEPGGSGNRRMWSDEDVWRLRILERLTMLQPLGVPTDLVAFLWEELDGKMLALANTRFVYLVCGPDWLSLVTELGDADPAAVALNVVFDDVPRETGWSPTHYSIADGSPIRIVRAGIGENEDGDQFRIKSWEWTTTAPA